MMMLMTAIGRKAWPTQCHTACWTRGPMSSFFSALYFSSWTTGQGVRCPPCDKHLLPNCTVSMLVCDLLHVTVHCWLVTCLWPSLWTAALTSWLVCPPFPVDHQCTFNRSRENKLRKHENCKHRCILSSDKLSHASIFPCWPTVHF